MAILTRPRGGDWLEDEVEGWRDAGIQIIVSLLEAHEADDLELKSEREFAEARGIRFVSFPIPDRGVPSSKTATLGLLSKLDTALEEGKNVGVHCRQGIGRSALIAASLLIGTGMSPAQAIATVSSARGVKVPETPEQLQWIRQIAAGHLVPTP